MTATDATHTADWRRALADLPAGARVLVRGRSGRTVADVVTACLDHRLVAVPVSPRTGDADAARLAGRVAASLLVDAPGGPVPDPRAAAGPVAVRPLAGGEPVHPDAADLAFIVFTSGSTGEPKGVMLDRAAVHGNAVKVARLHGFAPDRPHATCLPFHHVNALMMSLLGTRAAGAPLHVCEPFEPGRYFAGIAAAGARTAAIVPALLHQLLDAAPPWPDNLDYLVTAGAPLTSELAGRFHRRYGPRLRQGYGLSEAVNFSCTMPLLDDRDFVDQYVRRHPPVGPPLPGTRLRLEDGEVWLHTPDVMRGYWADPAATGQVLTADGWLRTGDLGELRDGFLVLTGRRGERINRGGSDHHPVELERAWASAGLAGEFVAVPVRADRLGQDVGLVLAEGSLLRAREVCTSSPVPPVAARAGGLLRTALGKPRRV